VVPAVTRGKAVADLLSGLWPETTAAAGRATRTGSGEALAPSSSSA
jgi:hypothetical protein